MSSVEQITFRELLKDPIYRAWLRRVPKLPHTALNGNTPALPWRVWVKMPDKPDLKHKWSKKDFSTYAKAYNWLMPRLKHTEDAALASKATPFKPPVIRTGYADKFIRKDGVRYPVRVPIRESWLRHHLPPEHEWCPYCRRPTLFRHFRRHHALRLGLIGAEQRCTICGARLIYVRGARA